MTITSFAATTRRGALRTLGGAAFIGALAAPTAVSAGKASMKAQQRCRRQREQCRTVFAEVCQISADAPACEAAYAPCCEHFSRCDAGKGIACIFLVD